MQSASFLYPKDENDSISFKTWNADSDAPWPALTNVLSSKNVKFALFFSRPEYQLESLFYYSCRSAQIPTVFGSVYNLSLTKKIISLIKPDLLVAEVELGGILLSHYEKEPESLTFSHAFLFSETEKRLPNTYGVGVDYYPYPF